MDESSINLKFLVLVSLLSIGGLVFLGWQAGIVGNASLDHQACCTIEQWRSAPTGFIQLGARTSTEYCSSFESAKNCCGRIASSFARARVLGALEGNCNPPQVNYPSAPPLGGYSACCSTETWQHAPTGYKQGVAKTQTEYCEAYEALNQCCLRASRARSDVPIRLLGALEGECGSQAPLKSYPVWISG